MAPPRRKSNTALIITIILICVLVPCIALIGLGAWGYFAVAKRNLLPLVGCGFDFRETRRSLTAYAKDHDGMLPKATEWQDAIRPYLIKIDEQDAHNRGPLKAMDPNKPFGCEPMGDAKIGSGMAFNTDVSAKKLSTLRDSEVLIYEIDAPRPNANAPYKDRGETAPRLMGMPREWITAPVRGHIRGMNAKQNSDFGNDWDMSDSSSSSDSPDSSDSLTSAPSQGDKTKTPAGAKADSKAQPATTGK